VRRSYLPVITSLSRSLKDVGDLNQDRIPDVLVGRKTDSGVVIDAFLGIGGGEFSPAVELTSLQDRQGSFDFPTATVFLSDLNQDGFPDVVAAGYGSRNVWTLLHMADGGYQASAYAFPAQVVVAAVPRVGAAPDLVAGYNPSPDFGEGVVQLLLNAGDGTFCMGTSMSVPNLANALSVSDFNGDCLPDIAVSSYGCNRSGTAVVYGGPDGFGNLALSLAPTAGLLTLLGPTSNPRALASDAACFGQEALVVFGDASGH
jgi:hypothetical protein